MRPLFRVMLKAARVIAIMVVIAIIALVVVGSFRLSQVLTSAVGKTFNLEFAGVPATFRATAIEGYGLAGELKLKPTGEVEVHVVGHERNTVTVSISSKGVERLFVVGGEQIEIEKGVFVWIEVDPDRFSIESGP